MTQTIDEYYMQRALDLAKRATGATNPNPLVGAVIVKNGTIIGEGYHRRCGELHAERNAFASLKKKEEAEGATIYVTLEPCCHYGKTPPCTEAVIEHKIARVVVGMMDPNPLVAGKGLQILKEQGIEVESGVLEEECRDLNRIFIHYIMHKTPFVTLKYAMTLDGKIAAYTGDSKWVTESPARVHVHEERNRHMGIMTGIGTVLADDPELTCRIPGGRNPIRIIADTYLRTPMDSRLVRTAGEIRTIILTGEQDADKHMAYKNAGVEIIVTPLRDGQIDLAESMKILGEMGIDGILLEGGATLNASALSAGIVHEVHAYVAPKIIGGDMAKTPVGGHGFAKMSQAIGINWRRILPLGQDLLLEGRLGGKE